MNSSSITVSPIERRVAGKRLISSNRGFTKLLGALLFAGIAASLRSADDDAVPIPPEFAEAQSTVARVESARTLPAEAKSALVSKFAALKAEFQPIYDGLVSTVSEATEKAQDMNREAEVIKRDVEIHNGKPHVFDEKQNGALAAYNAEKEELDSRENELKERYQTQMAAYTKEIQEKEESLNQWVTQSSAALADIKTVGTALLNGNFRFRKGLAWEQLVQAANGGADTVFENSDPNVVDARGVVPMTAEERRKEQNKPGVQQPRGFRITPNSEPPAPSP